MFGTGSESQPNQVGQPGQLQPEHLQPERLYPERLQSETPLVRAKSEIAPDPGNTISVLHPIIQEEAIKLENQEALRVGTFGPAEELNITPLEELKSKPDHPVYEDLGQYAQNLGVFLWEGQSIYVARGKMNAYTPNVEMKPTIKSITEAIIRKIGHETFIVDKFTSKLGWGHVLLGPDDDRAGEIIPIHIPKDGSVYFRRGSYLCSEEKVNLGLHPILSPLTGKFGGEGFLMESAKGEGKIHLIANGEILMYDLKKGEELNIDEGNLIAFDSTVNYATRPVKGGLKNWLLSGEGPLINTVKGPGRVWTSTVKKDLLKQLEEQERELKDRQIKFK